MLTKQQIFNKVAKHLFRQNKRVPGGEWVGDKGELCASAVLVKPSIRKGLTNEDFWNRGRSILQDSGIDWSQPDIFDIVNDLTECHDNNKPSRWPRKLRAIARKFNLKIPEYLKEVK